MRLARWGATHNPFYGIVVAHVRWPRDGKHLDRVGSYNPVPDRNGVKHITLDVERVKKWLVAGAQPSERVSWLLSIAGILPPTPKYLHKTNQSPPTPDASAYLDKLSKKEAKPATTPAAAKPKRA